MKNKLLNILKSIKKRKQSSFKGFLNKIEFESYFKKIDTFKINTKEYFVKNLNTKINLKSYFEKFKNFKNNSKNKLLLIKESWSDKDRKYDQIKYQEIRYKPTPKWTKSLQWAIVSIVGFGFTYSIIARIDEVVITQGDLQSQGAERPIKSPAAGIVSLIPVKEGDLVNSGDIILQFDQEINDSRILSINNQLNSEKLRLRAEENSFNAKKESLNSKKSSTETLLKTESVILKRYQNLLKVGAVAEIQMLQQKNKVVNLKSEFEQLQSREKEISSNYKQNIENIRKEISVLNRQLAETKKSQEYESFKSPIDGYIFDLIPSSIGYSVSNGEVLMKIIPIGEVEAKVFVTNQDVGFLKPNMEAQIRVNAFPFTQFGEIKGKLKLLGREVIQESQGNPELKFPVIVELEKQYLERKGKKYKVKAGQTVSVNFVVRDKPVISLITDAVEKAFDSMRGIKTDQP
tara:strand:+ start:422 stop:1801 length:1380 start_codon:yes stop_codon:yes gene_type:complete